MNKVSSIKTGFAQAGVEELKSPYQSPTEHTWCEHQLHPRPPHLTSVPDLTNALVAEWTNPHR